MMSFKRPFAVALMSATLLLWGCGQTSDGDSKSALGVPTNCDEASDCTSGLVCNTDWNICTHNLGASQTVGVAVTPAAGTALATGHLQDVVVDPVGMQDLTMPSTVRITGRVRVTNNPIQPSIPSVIVAIADDPIIPGMHLRTQTSATDEGYALDLVADVAYTVSVTVNDLARPTHRFTMQSTISRDNWDIELPPLDEYPQLSGRVFQATADGHQPVKGVRITAMRVDDYHQCTNAVTDKLGSYQLRCPFESGTYTVHLGPTDVGPVLPSFQAVWDGQDTIEVATDVPLGDIIIPESISDHPVTIQTQDEAGQAIGGIPITITTVLPDTAHWKNAIFMQTGNTDMDGLWTEQILVGAHRVVATPHTSSPWAYKAQADWTLDIDEVNTMTLQSKVLLSGTVFAHDGTPEPQARVVTRRRWTQAHTGLTIELEYATQSDDAGQFSLPVDPGSHAIAVVPATLRALPQWHADALTEVGNAGASLSIQLPTPTLMHGVITSNDGTLLSDATVSVYDLSTVNARLIGRGVTLEDGRYHVVLPSAEIER